jgi:hypothetical protein
VPADLPALKAHAGVRVDTDDDVLAGCLEAAAAQVRARVYETSWPSPDVQLAVLMSAARLYRRRQSATGVEGFDAQGFSVRVVSGDPDIRALLARHIDMTRAGVA